MESSAASAKFHTLQLFVYRSADADAPIVDIAETDAARAHVLKDVASEYITQGAGHRLELHAYDRPPTEQWTKLGTWPVVWELPARCRNERPCVLVDGKAVDLVRFVQSRS